MNLPTPVTLTRRSAGIFGARFLAALGVLAIPVGILAPIAPDWWDGKWWLVLLGLLPALAWACWAMIEREPRQHYREGVTIRLVFGDLFEQNASALVGMTTTFDTKVPEVIARNSVQGNLLSKVFDGSQDRFDQALDRALDGIAPDGRIEKPGKCIAYPLGTVAVLHAAGNVRYYCVAYTEMDVSNRAAGTIRGVLDSLDSVWASADTHGNGDPICVPLIGQGQSRIPELTPEMAIRLIAFSFLLRSKRSRFSRELRIVVHESERAKVDLLEFQAFLRSLAAA